MSRNKMEGTIMEVKAVSPSTATNVFALALKDMGASDFLPPQSFRAYIEKANCIGVNDTWGRISIDHIERLSPDLRAAEVMVFRLGQAKGKSNTTAFALARCKDVWRDYFLLESEAFKGSEPELFKAAVSPQTLMPFRVFPRLTESSLVNLAIASGLMSKALMLDDESCSPVPATGQSSYTFKVRPHSDIDCEWEHNNGQIEIDSLFVGKRHGVDVLFVIESKHGEYTNLAKHKLAYPMIALRQHFNIIGESMPIIPVAMRTYFESGMYHFRIIECTFGIENIISELNPVRAVHYVMNLP